MGFAHYLAMTQQEMASAETLPERGAWMGCGFSRDGLCNLPEELPEGWLLILDDRAELQDFRTENILKALSEHCRKLRCSGVLLDFQKPKTPALAALTEALSESLPCGAPPAYAQPNQPVFLPPLPLTIPLETYIDPWKGREIWLETALNCETVTLTATGAEQTILPGFMDIDAGFTNPRLHCHYLTDTTENAVVFTLWRTRKDLMELIQEAERLGIHTGIGLYQELGSMKPK